MYYSTLLKRFLKHSFPNYILLNILYKKHKIWQSYFVIYKLKMLTIGIEHLGYLLYIYQKLQSTKTPYNKLHLLVQIYLIPKITEY